MKLISKLSTIGIALLGFGCSSSENEGDMYGTPIGSFEFKGKVTDETGKSVEDATIKVTEPKGMSGVYSMTEGKTDESGDYIVEGSTFPIDSYKVVCLPDNPELQADSVMVDVEYIKDKKDKKNPWYAGHADATVDFKLKKKSEE